MIQAEGRPAAPGSGSAPAGRSSVRSGFVIPFREAAPAWLSLLLLAGLAWVFTVRQARGMGNGPGTMGMALPLFLALWVVMMSAMMFPAVAPVAILWTRSIVRRTEGTRRVSRMATFLAGYLLAWTGYGLLAFGALWGTERLVERSPTGARALGVAVFAVAGLYQLTPLKDVCLRHCRSPMTQLLRYASYRGPARDLRIGLHHGGYCVGCCWGLMVVLIAVGVMNVPVMAALAGVILLEKLWRHGEALSKVMGVALIGAAVVAPFVPSLLLPALSGGPAGPMTGGM